MNRRRIQSACIVFVFLAAFAGVIALGADQGKKDLSLQTSGIPLSEKSAWDGSAAPLPEPETDPIVYITNSGTKYHLSPDCPGLHKAKEVIGTRLSFAVADGKEPCSRCKEE